MKGYREDIIYWPNKDLYNSFLCISPKSLVMWSLTDYLSPFSREVRQAITGYLSVNGFNSLQWTFKLDGWQKISKMVDDVMEVYYDDSLQLLNYQ